jgi:zinc protease
MNGRSLLLLVALGAAVASTASCQCSRTQQERRVETLAERSVRLPNGLNLDLVSGPCGDAAGLVAVLGSGIDHDPPGKSGMAHVAARILAASEPPGRAQRTVEAASDHTLYAVQVPADKLGEELDEVAAWMSRAPTDESLGRARAEVLAAIAKQSSDPAQMAQSFAEESLQPTRGNGKRRGIAAEVQSITLAEMTAFWQATFKPGNAWITVAGRFDPEKLKARAEAAFGPLPAGTPPVARPPSAASVRGNLVMGDAPSAVALAVPAPAVTDPIYPAFLIQAARLMAKPAEARTWEAGYDPAARPELLFITGPVGKAEQPEPAAARMRTEVGAVLARPITPEDVKRVKETFRFLLEPHDLAPASCAKDPRAFAVGRARLAALRPEGTPLTPGLGAVTQEQLGEAAGFFDAKRSAAVIAGGAIR